tara:strand:+ start:290 stop:391 length:102 start_codon:yes stop_codon:yes gene_type:complete
MIDHTYAKLTDANNAIVMVANSMLADLIGRFFI